MNFIKPYIINKNSIGLLLIAFIIASCSPTKYVGKNQYLLNKVVVKTDNKDISSSELKKSIKQKSNLRILGFWRFHLGLYNLSGRNEKKGINKWLRRIGEEPFIYESYQTKRSISQLKLYLRQRGYYNAEVTDTVIFRNKKAKVIYKVTTKKPYRYRNIYDNIEGLPQGYLSKNQVNAEIPDSSAIRQYVINDSVNSLISKNKKIDTDILQKERIRILKLLKNKGYFNFSQEYVHFMMDSTHNNHQMDVFIGLSKPKNAAILRKYKIKQLKIITDFNPKLAMVNDSVYSSQKDSITHKDIKFYYHKKLKIKPSVVLASLMFKQGDIYNLKKVEQSYERLQSLNQFKFVNIKFEPTNTVDSLGIGTLNCIIQLTPYTRQSYSVELEGTNSSGNIGFAGNLNYQNKNLFKGAEIFDLQFTASTETVQSKNKAKFDAREYGVSSKFRLPKFLFPFLDAYKIRRKYNPKTVMSASFNYQRRPDYTRTIAEASFGYSWRSSKYVSHQFNLLEFNFVDVKDINSNFLDDINNLYIQNSFIDHVITTSRYSLFYSNKGKDTKRNYNYLRFNIESAGNTLHTLHQLIGAKKNKIYLGENKIESNYYGFLGIRYAQYLKSDIEYRYYQYINDASNMVYRFFFGIGYPYGNMDVLPFEKSYFSGGANGIRAWQVRSLGPGSYFDPSVVYPNNTGDIKLEANLEYRVKLFWIFEGAFFLDAGNIWSISKNDNREGAKFKFNNFYEQIAVGTGFGTRINLSFILFRIDLGLKVHDPTIKGTNSWVLFNRPLRFNQFTFNIGLGYPF